MPIFKNPPPKTPASIQYPLAQDTVDHEDIDRLITWLATYPRLTKGQVTLDFEAQWSSWLGRKYSVFCNSGSSANLLMLYVLLLSGRLKNKKVVVPSAGWVTSIAPAIQFGFEPLMCEADPDTFGLDLNALEDLLKKHKPDTVMMVQVLGVPHKMDQIQALKDKYGFILLEDACAAVGSSAYGRKLGTFGDLSSFSFYFGHQISTIEGGMVSTDDKTFYDLLLMTRSHGWSKDLDPSAHEALVNHYQIDDFHTPFVFYEPGFNLRSTDLNAYIGLKQLDKLDWIASRRHENHLIYKKNLENQFQVQRWDDLTAKVSSISFSLLAKTSSARQRVISALVEHGIETRVFTAGNLGRHPFWANRFGKASFPFADKLYETGFFLPNHPFLEPTDIDFISRVVLGAA